MKIMERIHHVSEEVEKDFAAGGTMGQSLHDAAVNAILGGINSEAWTTYMSIFADSEDQLKRLTGKDAFSQNVDWVKASLAYLAGNGDCGGMTPKRLPEQISEDIDLGITNIAPSAAVTSLRPFQVPAPTAPTGNPSQPENPSEPKDQPT